MQQLFSALPLQFKQLTDCLNVLYKIIRVTGIFKVCNFICAICAAQINARKILPQTLRPSDFSGIKIQNSITSRIFWILFPYRMVCFGALSLLAEPKTRWCSFLFYGNGEREKNQKRKPPGMYSRNPRPGMDNYNGTAFGYFFAWLRFFNFLAWAVL